MTGKNTHRRSPVSFTADTVKTAPKDGYEVVLEFAGQGGGPWLVDLSHFSKWDIQAGNLDDWKPWGIPIPSGPNQCIYSGGILINRLNHTQAAVWFLDSDAPDHPPEPNYTDLSEGLCLLAVVGREALSVMEKLTPLDLADPKKQAPYLVQGPVCRIPCQAVMLDKSDHPAVLMSFSRGYGLAMAETILSAGEEFGLRPGGETVFLDNLKSILSD